jgi:hypothetical protein
LAAIESDSLSLALLGLSMGIEDVEALWTDLGFSAAQRAGSVEPDRMTLDLYREVPGEMKSGMRSELMGGHFR